MRVVHGDEKATLWVDLLPRDILQIIHPVQCALRAIFDVMECTVGQVYVQSARYRDGFFAEIVANRLLQHRNVRCEEAETDKNRKHCVSMQ